MRTAARPLTLVTVLAITTLAAAVRAAPPAAKPASGKTTAGSGEAARRQREARAELDAHQAAFATLQLASRTAQFKLEVALRNHTLPRESVDALRLGALRAHEAVIGMAATLQQEIPALIALEQELGFGVGEAERREAQGKLAKLAEVQRALGEALDELPEFAALPPSSAPPVRAELPVPVAAVPPAVAAPAPVASAPVAPERFDPKGPKVGVLQCDLRKVDWPNEKLTIEQVLRFEQGTAPRRGSTKVTFLSVTLDDVAYLDSNQDGREEALLDLTFVDHFYDEEEDHSSEVFKGYLLEADSQCQVHLVAKLWDGSSASRSDAKAVAGGFDVLRHAQGVSTQLRDEWRWKAGTLSLARSVAARSGPR